METKAHAIPVDLDERLKAAPVVVDPDSPDRTLPDFAALYPLPEHTGPALGPGDEDWAPDYGCGNFDSGTCPRCDVVLTPRLAYLLYEAAEPLGNSFSLCCDLADHGDLAAGGELDGMLPPPVLRYLDLLPEADAAAWLGRFDATLEVLTARLAVGEVPTPRCAAEEVALHLALWRVPDLLNCRRPFGGTYRAVFETLPACDSRDTDYLLVSDLLLGDEDVLWLFDPQMDGIDDDSSELATRLGAADLHARDWFRSFQPQANPAPEFVPARPGHLRLTQSG